GYFETAALNPDGLGTGGGTGSYNDGQQCIIGVKPKDGGGGGGNAYSLNLYDYLSIPSTNIYYGNAFSVSTNIWNTGTTNFAGDYCAAAFDENLNFVDFVEIKEGWSLGPNNIYTDGITFSTNGLLSMLPGTYYIAVFYRETGGNWSIVANGEYLNILEVYVINPNAIELYSDIVVSPSTTVIQGKPMNVNLNILNDGFNTFFGSYSVDLYDLSGNWVENIAEINEFNGLPSGYIYLDPYLTFSSISVDAEPGTYLLALSHTWNGDDYELTGSSYYQNPIFITVQAEPLPPDIYENNNTVENSYSLPLNFINNSATKNTNGSTCHNGTDYDFYKINLPAGFDYTINPRIHDSFDSGNGNTYTLDGQFSYSLDGVNFSEAYDDVVESPVVVNNGGTLYFFVAPYFPGQTGTYLLDMQITRTEITSAGYAEQTKEIQVFPNPVSGVLNIDFGSVNSRFDQVKLTDLLGHVVIEQKTPGVQRMSISTEQLAPGMYVVVFESAVGTLSKTIMIAR
ncbi:MAG TPA: T9SS type A sorting domain-containing protein, partial [Saprospiraceae bacterium]|nr:T9SS type A sorting domain-containing protein [Saprospiraceae bacterium]